jgi:hypothetical protein
MSAFGGKADTPCNGSADAFMTTRPKSVVTPMVTLVDIEGEIN